jgi:endonuclease YncB( thermonuclease family)
MLSQYIFNSNSYPRKFTALLIAVFAIMFSGCDPADGKDCRVTKVYDGDTVTLKCPGEADVTKVRLYCIDTPEMKQAPWGEVARDHLRAIIGKYVSVVAINKDRYGRVVGEVYTQDGKNLNMEQVKDGYAAVYDTYCKKPEYNSLETKAKAAKLGIWAKSGMHQTPWEWRKQKREAD